MEKNSKYPKAIQEYHKKSQMSSVLSKISKKKKNAPKKGVPQAPYSTGFIKAVHFKTSRIVGDLLKTAIKLGCSSNSI